MSERMNALIEQAKQQYADIRVIATRKTYEESFTVVNDKLVFWFDTSDRSSHIIIEN